MLKPSLVALTDTLTRHIELSKSRVATLGMLIIGMVGARTVNLSHIASGQRNVWMAPAWQGDFGDV